MNAIIASGIVAIINGAFEIWRIHANKPEGWKPSPDDIANLVASVDAATPEAEKAAARQRLGLPE